MRQQQERLASVSGGGRDTAAIFVEGSDFRPSQPHFVCFSTDPGSRTERDGASRSEPWLPHLDVELQVLVHGVDVVKDVACDARNDAHQLGVVQFALNTAAYRITDYRWAGQFLVA